MYFKKVTFLQMSVSQIVQKLGEECNGRKRKDVIDEYEQILSEDVEGLSKNKNFFNLPLNNIFSVISKVNFNEIEENDELIEIIHNIINNTVDSHYDEKETILILQNLNLKSHSLSYEEILSILESITNCPILSDFCNLYKEQKEFPSKDYKFELQQKEKEIERLKQIIKELIKYQPIKEKPKDFEQDIFKACEQGKLTSIQWLIEKENTDKNITNSKGDSLLHIAAQKGHLIVVEYLVEKQNIDINIKGSSQMTPLYYASKEGHLPIVEYLISKGADINSKDEDGDTPIHIASQNDHLSIVQYIVEKCNEAKDFNNNYKQTPLHYACREGHLSIVKYLISKGANINAQDNLYGRTPLHNAASRGRVEIVKYLIGAGAKKDPKDKSGKTPFDVTKKDEIKAILK